MTKFRKWVEIRENWRTPASDARAAANNQPVPSMDDGTDWATPDNPYIPGANNKIGDKRHQTQNPNLWIVQSYKGFMPTDSRRNSLSGGEYYQDYNQAYQVGLRAVRGW